MSRRLRAPAMAKIMRALAQRIQRRLPNGRLLLTDGKIFTLEDRTRDPDASVGRASGRYAYGYKLPAPSFTKGEGGFFSGCHYSPSPAQ